MVERTAVVRNRLGIHARPAAMLVKTASVFKCEIALAKGGLEVNGKSIMGVMMLAAEQGSTVLVRTEGESEALAADRLVDVIESVFEDELGESHSA